MQIPLVHISCVAVVICIIKCDDNFEIHLFQQRITAAIMPPVAFVAVPRLPLPPLDFQPLLPASGTGLMMKETLQSKLHYGHGDDEDAGSLQDYQQQTISSSPVLLQRTKTERNEQLT